MNQNKTLQVGEKYLSIKILGSLNVCAFKNKSKQKPTDPDFMGNGIAIWVKEKQEPQTKVNEVI